MSKFDAKKKLLAAESEAYRQLLKLEIQTLKVHATRAKRQFTSKASFVPLIMTGVPLLGVFFGRKRGGSSFKKMSALALVAWKAFQRFSPMFSRRPRGPEGGQSAAEEYLSRRL